MKIKEMGLLLGGMLFALSANASVTSYTSGVELVTLGSYNVTNTASGNENDKIVVFEERYSFQLADDLITDTGTVSANTYIGSYFINFNPVGTGIKSSNLQQISFSDQILGVIYLTDTLNATDATLGNSNVIYPTNSYYWRGLESGGGTGDSFSILGNTAGNLLNVANNGVDQMRVITAAPVPLPAAVWMFGAGLISLVGFARRSANKAATAAV